MTALARTSQADGADAAARRDLFVLFRVGEAHYAVAAEHVLQMETYTGSTPVPGSASFVAGIVNVRGRVVPVVDLRRRFGLPPTELTLDSRIVVGQYGERAVALLADSAREVVKLGESDMKPPPRVADDASAASGFVRGVVLLGERTVLVLDFAKVIGEESIDVGQR